MEDRVRKRSLISTKGRVRKRWMVSTKDRVSALPDSILCHILSFLPTKFAARTSILSKRWKPIWLSVTTLDFPVAENAPNHIIYSVILSRDIKCPILSIRLTCHYDYEPDKPEVLDSVIMAAIQRRVETLELNMLAYPIEMKFFSNIFSSNTLTVLKLKNLYILEDLPRINVSSIKTLHLDMVRFTCHSYMINFFLAFPILEELQTNDICLWEKVPQPREMIKCLPNLVRANINDPTLIPFLGFSRALILNVKQNLRLFVQIPNFYNLTQMELFINYEQRNWMLKVLQHTPKLQHLIINEEIENDSGIDEKNWEDPKMVPECLSSQLKTCLFGYWRGKKCQLQFAEYIMRSSTVLSTLTIHCHSSLDLNTKNQILQKLSLYPRGSRGCKLIFN